MADRPDVPEAWIHRLDDIFARLPQSYRERAWVGSRWRVGQATIAHIFGGEDQLFRIVFRADLSEVMAFESSGPPYFRAGWGQNVVGVVVDGDTDWAEVAEMLTESYCLQAPARLAAEVTEPGGPV